MTPPAAPRSGPVLVWYAGYGSNLWAERFRCYLEGGTAAGATGPCRGARDQTPPRRDRAIDIPYRLYFAGHSRTWDGAPAFVDTVPSATAATHARAYLITWEQFEDVVAQENGRSTSPLDLGFVATAAAAAATSSIRLGAGPYENLLCVGPVGGFPVVTFTAPTALAEAEPRPPAPAYLRAMVAGLREAHALSDSALVAYLGAAPGCSEQLAASALAPRPASED